MSKNRESFFLGVEWVGEQLRAGVYDERWRLRGKASRSTKAERGFTEVLKRIALCALDAVDEADLRPDAIAATALLTNGVSTGQTLGPQQVNQLAIHLPASIGSRFLTAGRVATVLWAVHEHELGGQPKSWMGLFTEPEPDLFVADRELPGKVRHLPNGTTWAPRFTEAPIELIELSRREQAAAVVCVGAEFEDQKSKAARRLQDALAAAGTSVEVHVPQHGIHVGTWAAARLAARTFAAAPNSITSAQNVC